MKRTLRAMRLLVLCGCPLVNPSLTHADVVLDWNIVTMRTAAAAPFNPPLESRNAAIVHAAMFDAVNSIVREFHHYAVRLRAPAGASAEAAAVAAAHFALVQLYPDQREALDAAYADSLVVIPSGPGKANGITLGEAVAARILNIRSADGAAAAITAEYTPGVGPGFWIPTPPAFLPALDPGWGSVRPFLMEDECQFRPGPPPALTSRRYTRDFDEIKEIGSSTSTTRTPEQTGCRATLDCDGSPELESDRAAGSRSSPADAVPECEGVCTSQSGRRGCVHRGVGCEVHLQPMAPGDGDSSHRRATATRRQSKTRRGRRCLRRPRSPTTSPATRRMAVPWRKSSSTCSERIPVSS